MNHATALDVDEEVEDNPNITHLSRSEWDELLKNSEPVTLMNTK